MQMWIFFGKSITHNCIEQHSIYLLLSLGVSYFNDALKLAIPHKIPASFGVSCNLSCL